MKQGAGRSLLARLFAMAALANAGVRIRGNQGSHAVTGKLGGMGGFAFDARRAHLRRIRDRRSRGWA